MKFKTVSQFDDEIKKIDKMMDDYKKYIKKHPKNIGAHTNHKVLEYVRDELEKERDKLIASLCYKNGCPPKLIFDFSSKNFWA